MKIILFHKQSCPYSKKVRDFIEASHLQDQIEYRDTSEGTQAAEQLVSYAHTSQVPCLVVDGTPILESDSIIDWLKENLIGSAAEKAFMS